MIRVSALLLALVVASPAVAETARLRAEATVSEDIVRLRDLIDHAGPRGDVAVFRAPDLGHTGQVPAWQVLDAARRAGLDPVAAGDVRDIAVTRSARVVPLAEMEERVADSIANSLGLTDTSRIRVSFDRGTRPMAVEASARGALDIIRLDHDARSGRFEAVLAIRDASNGRRAGGFRLSGTAQELVEFVVPTRTIGRGEVIRAGDLTVERRPRGETVALSGDSIVSLTQAVGLAARRPLQSERGFRLSDLMKPELVERNGNVLIILDMPGLSLSVRGKALEAGAEGEVIQVQNLQSRKTLQAVVTGPGRVAVRLNGSSIVAAGPTP